MQARVDALVCACRCVNISDGQFSELTELNDRIIMERLMSNCGEAWNESQDDEILKGLKK